MLVARRERGEILAIERMLRNAGARIDCPVHLLEVLHVASHAVLGTEERRELHPFGLVQQVREMAQLRIDARRVADRPDTQALELSLVDGADQPGFHHQYAFRERNPKAIVRSKMRRSRSRDQCSM